jgi:hypothetical protein
MTQFEVEYRVAGIDRAIIDADTKEEAFIKFYAGDYDFNSRHLGSEVGDIISIREVVE